MIPRDTIYSVFIIIVIGLIPCFTLDSKDVTAEAKKEINFPTTNSSFTSYSSYPSPTYSDPIHKRCMFYYSNGTGGDMNDCIIYSVSNTTSPRPESSYENVSVIKDPIEPTINFIEYNDSRISKMLVKGSIPSERYDNVAEPSFSSDNFSIFYTGNHYAAKKINDSEWQYVDPYYDFKGREGTVIHEGTINEPFNLFWADQRTIYDKQYKLFLWMRQGEIKLFSDKVGNIDRLSISKDLENWHVYDLKPSQLFSRNVSLGFFDYPELIVGDKHLYITTSMYSGVSTSTGNTTTYDEYGVVIRISLNELNNLNNTLNFEAIIDSQVKGIIPVENSNDPMYFGSHLKNDPFKMKIFKWYNNGTITNPIILPISPWNTIHNLNICSSLPSDKWWCNANTDSRLRSAWLYNNTLSFLWNAVTTYNNGSTYVPYIESATFNTDGSNYERKYQFADKSNPWIFGAAIPGNDDDVLGGIAYFVDNTTTNYNGEPFLNFAFGTFNESSKKWDMMPILESNFSLPVENEKNEPDYNFGDFITIRKHHGDPSDFKWDIGGYVIMGDKYNDIESYFIKSK